MKRLEIQVLSRAGLPPGEVARQTDVGERTVYRVREEPEIQDVARTDAERSKRMGRPSALAAHEPQIVAWLEAEPALKSIAIVERLREVGYAGGKSAVFAAVARLRRPPVAAGVVRFEAVPGEFSQHDFGEVTVRYADGTREHLHFFASRLKYSRTCRMRLVKDQRVERVCEGLLDAFTVFGGVPLIAVFDNPRTIVTARDGKHVTWNETFAQFCAEAEIVPKVTWPYRPQEKGAVENVVGFVKSSFFKAHLFQDRRDLEAKLAAWHVRVNEERPCRATGEIPAIRHLVERERLKPLRISVECYRLRHSRVVRTDGHVEFEGKRFYVGAKFIGQTVSLRVGTQDLEVHAGFTRVCVHPRVPKGRTSILPEQRRELLEKAGARSYVKRQFLMELCQAGEWLMTELRHRRPDRWEEDVERLFALLEKHGEQRVRAALIEAARLETVGAEYVEAILLGSTQAEVAS